MRSEVLQLTGPEAGAAHHLSANITVRRIDRFSWSLSLDTIFDGITGERTLSAGSCESLAEAAALTLALMLNPQLAPPSPPSPATPPKPVGLVASQRQTSGRRWTLGVEGGVVAGVVATATSSFGVSTGLALGRLSVRLLASATPPQDLSSATDPRVGGRLWTATVSGLGCWGPRFGPVTPAACVGFDGTRIHGHGVGVLHPRDATAYWNAAELAARVELRAAKSILIELGVTGLLPLTRPDLYLEAIASVSRPAAFGIRGWGGVAWIFR